MGEPHTDQSEREVPTCRTEWLLVKPTASQPSNGRVAHTVSAIPDDSGVTMNKD